MAAIELRDRPIVITGASSGIGRATAIACAKVGMPVVLAARRLDRLEQARTQIAGDGGRAIAVACDVACREDCERTVRACRDAFGEPYAVFANAGFGYEAPALNDEQRLRHLLEVNFFGSLHIIRPAMAAMLERGQGHVLVCSSCLSKIGLPYYSAYSMSKAMQDHFARALRLELWGSGVHVSSVHPIGTRTEFFDELSRKSEGRTLADGGSDRFMQPPERVARAIVRCLRKPRGEVWTSRAVRLALACSVACPGLTDALLARKVARRRRRLDPRTGQSPPPESALGD